MIKLYNNNFSNHNSSKNKQVFIFHKQQTDIGYIKKHLESEKFQTETFLDSDEIVNFILESIVDMSFNSASDSIFLLEYEYEKECSFKTINTIKANNIDEHIPVIFFSTASDTSIRTAGMDQGCDDMFFLPQEIHEMQGIIMVLFYLVSLVKSYSSYVKISNNFKAYNFKDSELLTNLSLVFEYFKNAFFQLSSGKISLLRNMNELQNHNLGEMIWQKTLFNLLDLPRTKDLIPVFLADMNINMEKSDQICKSVYKSISNVMNPSKILKLTFLKNERILNIMFETDCETTQLKNLLKEVFHYLYPFYHVKKYGLFMLIEMSVHIFYLTVYKHTYIIFQIAV